MFCLIGWLAVFVCLPLFLLITCRWFVLRARCWLTFAVRLWLVIVCYWCLRLLSYLFGFDYVVFVVYCLIWVETDGWFIIMGFLYWFLLFCCCMPLLLICSLVAYCFVTLTVVWLRYLIIALWIVWLVGCCCVMLVCVWFYVFVYLWCYVQDIHLILV